MTTGELDFDDLFRQSPNGESENENEIQFEAVSYILWIIFIVIMPILLTNMLVSFACPVATELDLPYQSMSPNI